MCVQAEVLGVGLRAFSTLGKRLSLMSPAGHLCEHLMSSWVCRQSWDPTVKGRRQAESQAMEACSAAGSTPGCTADLIHSQTGACDSAGTPVGLKPRSIAWASASRCPQGPHAAVLLSYPSPGASSCPPLDMALCVSLDFSPRSIPLLTRAALRSE